MSSSDGVVAEVVMNSTTNGVPAILVDSVGALDGVGTTELTASEGTAVGCLSEGLAVVAVVLGVVVLLGLVGAAVRTVDGESVVVVTAVGTLVATGAKEVGLTVAVT